MKTATNWTRFFTALCIGMVWWSANAAAADMAEMYRQHGADLARSYRQLNNLGAAAPAQAPVEEDVTADDEAESDDADEAEAEEIYEGDDEADDE